MREGVEVKGRRYVVEARLRIQAVTPYRIEASCRGNGEFYAVGYERGGWYCTCPALGRCAHLVAVQLVTTRPGGGGVATQASPSLTRQSAETARKSLAPERFG